MRWVGGGGEPTSLIPTSFEFPSAHSQNETSRRTPGFAAQSLSEPCLEQETKFRTSRHKHLCESTRSANTEKSCAGHAHSGREPVSRNGDAQVLWTPVSGHARHQSTPWPLRALTWVWPFQVRIEMRCKARGPRSLPLDLNDLWPSLGNPHPTS